MTGAISRHFKAMGESAQGGRRKTQKYAPKREAVKDFIKKLEPLEIHYCRSKIKSRQYLKKNRAGIWKIIAMVTDMHYRLHD